MFDCHHEDNDDNGHWSIKMSEKLCLQWSDFKDNVNSAFGRLKDDKEFTDVTLVCEDGQKVNGTPRQCVTRSLFQFSRREREFLSSNLMFETRTRISFSQSRASRREREFLFSISGFETRTRIEIETILAKIALIWILVLVSKSEI